MGFNPYVFPRSAIVLTPYSVGIDTESLMQSIVDTGFGGCTVLAVIHLTTHIALYSKVALICDGELEYGEPFFLISDEGKFSELHWMNGTWSEDSLSVLIE